MILEIHAEDIVTEKLLQELENKGLRPVAFAVIVEKIGKEEKQNGY